MACGHSIRFELSSSDLLELELSTLSSPPREFLGWNWCRKLLVKQNGIFCNLFVPFWSQSKWFYFNCGFSWKAGRRREGETLVYEYSHSDCNFCGFSWKAKNALVHEYSLLFFFSPTQQKKAQSFIKTQFKELYSKKINLVC